MEIRPPEEQQNVETTSSLIKVHLEDLNLEAMKAFTWSPNPKKYRSHDPNDQYEALLNHVFFKKEFRHTFDKFVFIPELTEDGNVHIHGIYHVKDNIKYHKWFLPICKLYGFVKIKGKVDKGWIDYICEDCADNEELFFHQPYPLYDYDYDELYQLHWSRLRDKVRAKVQVKQTLAMFIPMKKIKSKYGI